MTDEDAPTCSTPGDTDDEDDTEKSVGADSDTLGSTEQVKEDAAGTNDDGVEDDSDTDEVDLEWIEEHTAEPLTEDGDLEGTLFDPELDNTFCSDDEDGEPKGSMGITADQPDDAPEVHTVTWEEARGLPDRDYIGAKKEGGEGRTHAIYGEIYHVRSLAEDVCWVSAGDAKITEDTRIAPDSPGNAADVHGDVAAGYATYETDQDDDGEEYISTIDTILNADLSVEAVLEYPHDEEVPTEIILEVAPTTEHHEPVTVQAPLAALETARDFREQILAEVPGVVLKGGQNAVNILKQIVSADMAGTDTKYAHEEITTVEVGDETRLVTPMGTLGPDGWIDDDMQKHVWSDTANRAGVVEMWELSPEKIDADVLDTAVAAEATEKLIQSRDPNRDRWLSIIGYVTASTYRPTLTNPAGSPLQHWSILDVAGQSDSGKSASLEQLAKAIGTGATGNLLSLGSDTTPHALLDAMSKTDVVTLGLDEYDSSQVDQSLISTVNSYAKSASTGEMSKKSDSRYGDHSWHLESPLVISGEEQLDRTVSSLTTRAIEIPFSRTPTHEGSPGRRAFHDLSALTDDDGRPAELHHALAWWQHSLAFNADTDAVHSEWRDAAQWARDELAERGLTWGEEINSERIMQHAETVAFGLRRYRAFCEHIGADVDLTDEQIGDTIEYVMRQKVGKDSASTNNMDQFFELFGSANRASIDYIDEYEDYERWYADNAYLRPGEEFDFVHRDTSKKTRLRVHPKDAIAAVSKYARDHGLDVSIPDAGSLRNWVEQAADDPDSYAEGVGLRTNGRRHIGVYVEDLVDTVDVAHADIDPRKRVPGGTDDDGDDGEAGSKGKHETESDGMDQATRRGMIRRMVEREERGGYADRDTVEKMAAAASNCGVERIEADIDKMKQNGEIYVPQEGKLGTA